MKCKLVPYKSTRTRKGTIAAKDEQQLYHIDFFAAVNQENFVVLLMQSMADELHTVSNLCILRSYINMHYVPSTACICDKNALPRPAPSEAPLIKPAISVRFKYAGYVLGGCHTEHSHS
jgi:hypothetical protein